MENKSEIQACLQLVHWKGVSVADKLKVVTITESFSKAVELTLKDWESLLDKSIKAKCSANKSVVEKDLAWLALERANFIPYTDKRYPENLKNINDSPLGLFVLGDDSVLSDPQIAIVGSRNLTPTGEKIASEFSQNLVQMGLCITSGLAKGIDAVAHSAACNSGGKSIAVLGCGIDIMYPRQNRMLANLIQSNGCIVSEFSIGTPPKRENFPRRNRIISGLSEGVLVIEAAIRSGSLITARQASEQGKEVFAVPGSIYSPQSKGCHWLIRQGAVLTESIDDILIELELPLQNKILQMSSKEEQQSYDDCQVLTSMDYSPISIEQLVMRCQLDFQIISQRLTELELDGLIARAHNGDYYRLT